MDNPTSKPMLQIWKDQLHAHGLRVTYPRRLVMDIILSSSSALTPQEIYEISLGEEQSLGIASVYRTIELLEKLGLVQQVHKPDGCHGFWPALKGHHHYLICSGCGRMEVIPGHEEIDRYIHSVENETGYHVDDHWLQLFGQCHQCLN